MNEEALGRALQAARKQAGLTQQQLCQKAQLSYSTLAKIERGAIKSPAIFTVHSIASALNLTLDELLADILPKAQKKRESLTGIRFVYFDVNGCLVHFFHRAFMALAQDTNKPADMIETTFWHYNDAVCKGEMPMEEFNEILSEQLESPGLDWRDYYLQAVEPIEEIQSVVHWVAEHYRVGLLSNIMPGEIDQMIARGILPQIEYDVIIDSSKVGAIKPDDAIYEMATAAAGLDPSQILFIDDSRDNIKAAERLGWRVLWFDAFRAMEGSERIRETLRFES